MVYQRFALFSTMMLGMFLITDPAWATCSTTNNKCTNVTIEKLVGSDDGNIYAELSGGSPGAICSPAIIDGYESAEFVSIHKDAVNFYGVSAMLRITHEQDRPIFEIQLYPDSSGCNIRMVHSKHGQTN